MEKRQSQLSARLFIELWSFSRVHFHGSHKDSEDMFNNPVFFLIFKIIFYDLKKTWTELVRTDFENWLFSKLW
jgi:hypothetical protein